MPVEEKTFWDLTIERDRLLAEVNTYRAECQILTAERDVARARVADLEMHRTEALTERVQLAHHLTDQNSRIRGLVAELAHATLSHAQTAPAVQFLAWLIEESSKDEPSDIDLESIIRRAKLAHTAYLKP